MFDIYLNLARDLTKRFKIQNFLTSGVVVWFSNVIL